MVTLKVVCVLGVVLLCSRDLNLVCSPKSWRVKSLCVSQLRLKAWCLLKWEVSGGFVVFKNTYPILYEKKKIPQNVFSLSKFSLT